MATISRKGFGQVEPNHLSAQRTGQIYAQLPAAADYNVLENGQFVKYDYANGEVNKTGAGEWMLVFNEVKLYDDWRESYKDFALEKGDFTDGILTPRVFKTNIGDIYTTNCVGGANISKDAEYAGIDLEVGDVISPNTDGFLATDGDETIKWEVVKVYTMPDGQPGVKIMRIA